MLELAWYEKLRASNPRHQTEMDEEMRGKLKGKKKMGSGFGYLSPY